MTHSKELEQLLNAQEAESFEKFLQKFSADTVPSRAVSESSPLLETPEQDVFPTSRAESSSHSQTGSPSPGAVSTPQGTQQVRGRPLTNADRDYLL
ncbi:hypothetical protein HDU98_002800, partial [Podochytrium sp. JEL0797]